MPQASCLVHPTRPFSSVTRPPSGGLTDLRCGVRIQPWARPFLLPPGCSASCCYGWRRLQALDVGRPASFRRVGRLGESVRTSSEEQQLFEGVIMGDLVHLLFRDSLLNCHHSLRVRQKKPHLREDVLGSSIRPVHPGKTRPNPGTPWATQTGRRLFWYETQWISGSMRVSSRV